MSLANLNIEKVNVFWVVQADNLENHHNVIVDEKAFLNFQDALTTVRRSEAPLKYLKFHYKYVTYKIYPILKTKKYRVLRQLILN